MSVLGTAAIFWRVLKLAATQLRDTYLSCKEVVGDLVSVYYPGFRRKKYTIWIIYDIALSSLLKEAATTEVMW